MRFRLLTAGLIASMLCFGCARNAPTSPTQSQEDDHYVLPLVRVRLYALPPGTGTERVLVTREAISQGVPADQLTQEAIEETLQTESIPGAEREVARRALAPLAAWHAARKQDDELGVDIEAAEADLERLKTHLSTLGNSESESAKAQLMRRILEREEALSTLHAKQRTSKKERQRRQDEFEAVLGELEKFREALLEGRKRQQAATRKPRT